MKQAKVQFDEDKEAKVFSNLKDLDLFLDDLHSEFKHKEPIIVSMEMEELNVSFGLGSSLSFIQVIKDGNMPPYLITLGDENLDGEIVFYFQAKHHTEIPKSYLVPIQKARNIVREFYKTGMRSELVSWAEV